MRSKRLHIKIQNRIKRLAESHGFKAEIEQPTPDGTGRVDVGLLRDNLRIACEVTVTTPVAHEMAKLLRLINMHYDHILICSEDAKHLHRIEQKATEELQEQELSRVAFKTFNELTAYFGEFHSPTVQQDKRIKGYRSTVSYTKKSTPRKSGPYETDEGYIYISLINLYEQMRSSSRILSTQ